jgi:serine protease AprX
MRRRVLLIATVLLLAGGTQAVGTLQEDTIETMDGERTRLLVSVTAWPPPATLEHRMDRLDVTVEERFTSARTLLVDAPTGARTTLEAHPVVAGVHEDEPLEPMLASSKEAAGVTDRLHEAGVTGEGVNVAIVDSGVAGQHPGLDDEVRAQYTVDDDGVHEGADEASKHGTHVAGILTGSGEGAPSERGDVSGVAPASQLVSFDISEDFTTSNALRAFEWIYQNHEDEDIRVVTNAWGRLESPATYDPDDPIVRASSALVDEDVVTVFSAGNGGGQDSRMTVESTNPDVITVGATTDDGEVESYSSRGPVYDQDGEPVEWTKPDLVAPGSHVVSTNPAGEPGPAYIEMNGTSMAAPHVAGAAALTLQQRPDLSAQEVKGLLVRGAEDVGPTGVDDSSGAGMVDAASSIRILEEAEGSMETRSRSSEHGEELTGPAQAGSVLSETQVEHEDSFEVTVPANGTEIELSVTWEGEGELETRLVRPDGSQAVTASVDRERTIAVQEPDEGTWTVEVEPQDVTRGRYEANATVTWLEPVNGTALPFSAEDGPSGGFPSTGSPFAPWERDWLPGVPNIVLMLAGGALTVATLVSRRARR